MRLSANRETPGSRRILTIVAREIWSVGDAYEAYVGRWSRRVAEAFLRRLDVPAGRRWLDVGCGTGALTETVSTLAGPAYVVGVDTSEGEVPTVFADFDDYWDPFLGGQGPAPGYVMSLTAEHRRALHDLLRTHLPFGLDGSIPLTARAWAVRGTAARDSGSVDQR